MMSCKCKPIYAKRNTEAQGSHYTKHVCHMTGEGLHDKSEIAAELAHRDIEIERLNAIIGSAVGICKLSIMPHEDRPSERSQGRIDQAEQVLRAIE